MTAPDPARDGYDYPPFTAHDILGKLRKTEAEVHRLILEVDQWRERALQAEEEVNVLTHGVLSAIRRDHRDGRTGIPCLVRALVGGAGRVVSAVLP